MQEDETLPPLDPTCPVCKKPHHVYDEVFDGSERQCRSCGHVLVCVIYTDGSSSMELYWEDPLCRIVRTGRQRTRARWAKQGRRG